MLICKHYNYDNRVSSPCSSDKFHMVLHSILAFLVIATYIHLYNYILWYEMELSCTLCLKEHAVEAI